MNILVTKNYTVQDHSRWYNNRSGEANLVANYDQMQQIMTATAQQHIVDLDGVHVFTGTADNIRTVFVANFKEIYDLWREGHNILYADLDVVFVNAYTVFGTTDYFSMFNYTEPTATYDHHYQLDLPHFFNCGIRYYPQSMDQSVWDLGFRMLENFDWNRWDSEQVIYNAMQWSQSSNVADFLQPVLAYQYLSNDINFNNSFNGIDIAQACAVHVHGSRGSANRLQTMMRLGEQHGV